MKGDRDETHYMVVIEHQGMNYVRIDEIVRYCQRTMDNIALHHLAEKADPTDPTAVLAQVLAKGMYASLETVVERLQQADASDAVVLTFPKGGDDERDGDEPEGGV